MWGLIHLCIKKQMQGGILLGPSAIGRSQKFLDTFFPKKSLTVLDTLANVGLLFFLFLVGLELDMRSIRRTGYKALCIALAGITFPFVLGIGTSFALRATISKNVDCRVTMSILEFHTLKFGVQVRSHFIREECKSHTP